MKKKMIAAALAAVLALTLLAGCAKENKYVRLGVEMSTAGMSLYLTNTAVGPEKLSNYVFFAESPEECLEKLALEKQGIDIAYVPVETLALIGPDDPFTVVFLDTFGTDGSIKGVWLAADRWLTEAPTYSARFLRSLAKCLDYRAEHLSMSYLDALASVVGMRDFDFTVQNEVMQFCAIFAAQNNDKLADEPFTVMGLDEMAAAFAGEGAKDKGPGWQRVWNVYQRYGAGTGKTMPELFRLELMQKALCEAQEARDAE